MKFVFSSSFIDYNHCPFHQSTKSHIPLHLGTLNLVNSTVARLSSLPFSCYQFLFLANFHFADSFDAHLFFAICF